MDIQGKFVGFSPILIGIKGKVRLKLTFKEEGASQIFCLLTMHYGNELKILFRSIEELTKIAKIYSFGGTSREIDVQFKMNNINLEEFTSKFLDNPNVIENAEVVDRTQLAEENSSVMNPEDAWESNPVIEGSIKFNLGVLFYYKKNKGNISYEISFRRNGTVYFYARDGRGRISFHLDEKSKQGYTVESFNLSQSEETKCAYSWMHDDLLKPLVLDKFYGISGDHKTLVELTALALNHHFE